jgi:hypothetical protein
MGSPSLSDAARPLQGPPWQRLRRCLLKDCDQWFRPTRPQCRYCSPACQQAARRWRRWRAQQKYRASDNGRQRRQQQARRYRQRRPAAPRPPPAAAESDGPTNATSAGAEGKRLPEKSDDEPLRPCDRPGCYVLFAAGCPCNPRRFCCVLCCRALRRVLDREARWRRRRRRGLLPCGRRRRPAPHRRE